MEDERGAPAGADLAIVTAAPPGRPAPVGNEWVTQRRRNPVAWPGRPRGRASRKQGLPTPAPRSPNANGSWKPQSHRVGLDPPTPHARPCPRPRLTKARLANANANANANRPTANRSWKPQSHRVGLDPPTPHARPCPRPRLPSAGLANDSANRPNCEPLMEASVQSNADRAASRSVLRRAGPSDLHLPRAVPGAEACAIRPFPRMQCATEFEPNSVQIQTHPMRSPSPCASQAN